MCIVPYLYIQISTGSPNGQFGRQAITRWISLSKPADVRVVVASSEVVEVAIGVPFLASELAGVIACACLRANSPKDIILIPCKHILVVIR